MRYITKEAVIKLLKTFFPTKKNFEVKVGRLTGWIYVKIDDSSRMGPEELYKKTGIDLRGLKLYNKNIKTDNLKLWKDLILK